MDLEQVGLAAHALGKLVGLGMSAWKASHAPLGPEDLSLLKDVADNLSSLAPKKGTPRPPARQAALVAAAFGEAWRQHWALATRAKPGELGVQWRDFFFSASPQRDLLADASKRLKAALVQPADRELLVAAEELEAVGALIGDPLATPYYRAFLAAFTGPGTDGAAPLLPLEPRERVEFERKFLRAYHEGLASPEAAEVREYLLGLTQDRARLVRDLLVADIAQWGSRHVFGNALGHDALPQLPLGALYVEPQATAEWQVGARKQRQGPRVVQKLLATLGEKHPLVLVVADFGLGKSLTARTRALELASAYLDGTGVSPDLELPIFIKCAEDFTSAEPDPEKIIRRALQRHARELGLELPLTDPALAPPAADQRTCILLDGLDEIALGEKQVANLLRELRERAGARHRFVVFSRPAAVPPSTHAPEVPRVRLREFTTAGRDKQPGGQVGEWLDKWNALRPESPPVTVQELARRKLLDLAPTPILLFMIAFTWELADGGPVTGVELFERFFRQIARGKHEADLGAHPAIAAASARLRDALVARELVEPSADAVEAMLWLLGRVAWEAVRRESRNEPLSSFHVERIVREELGLAESAEVARAIRTSLLLVLQADLESGEAQILFGHRAFKEYLVARHWADVLRRIANASSHNWRALELELAGARLIEPDGKAHEFLCKLLFAWDDGARRRVAEWAAWSFNEERLPEGCPSFAEDPRPLVREAALFLGSTLPESAGIACRSSTTLRSLLAWMWLKGKEPRIFATHLRSPGAELTEANLSGARLEHADLRGAVLTRAHLEDALLFRADLSKAKLDGVMALRAKLDEANLEHAHLREAFLSGGSLVGAKLAHAALAQAYLTGSDLRRADLTRAILNGAHLEKANLHGATLASAELARAKLGQANLTAADLARANLHAADLKRAVLAQAVLQDAVLRDANLKGADLRGADLRRANLSGANLEGADLGGADLRDAILDGAVGADLSTATR